MLFYNARMHVSLCYVNKQLCDNYHYHEKAGNVLWASTQVRNVLQTLHAGVTLTVYYANGSVITALVIFILPQNTWGSVAIYCVEGLDEKLSDSFHFGWDERNTMRRNRGDVLWQTVDENHFLLHGCITSAEQRERVVVRGMGVVWHYGIYGIWNYVNPDLDREIIQRINLQLHCWFVVNWYG